MERAPVIFPTLFWKFSLFRLIFLNFSSVGLANALVIIVWQVLKAVWATPGYLSSVYSVLTVFNPCVISSRPCGPFGLAGSWMEAPAPPADLPKRSSLSLLSCSSMAAFALRNSLFSLYWTSSAILACCSSIFFLASDNSLATLILFFSVSSAIRLSSASLFSLICSCNSLAFAIFSSLVSELCGFPDDPSFCLFEIF